MAQQRGRPTPDVLARELRVVVKIGARASRLVYRLDQMPGLCQLTGKDPSAENWDCAVAVVALVRRALDELGEGQYGEAARDLFGLHPAVLGLQLGRRRMAAAETLGVSTGTLVRHQEKDLICDTAVLIYELAGPSDGSAPGE